MITIRYAKKTDIDQLLRHWMELHNYHIKKLKAGKDLKLARTARQNLRACFNDIKIPNQELLVACEQDKLAGFCDFEECCRPSIYEVQKIIRINYLYVSSDYRKHGVGKSLLEKLMAIKKTRNIREIEVSPYITNEAAISWYASQGFRKKSLVLVL
ncbi:Acetyltransferase (GNAT) family protein [Candidatus Bilamarchaeum dharawalense]|uniref:Acetyltransferase (GNAT) family protein n=1 Tax=Candidatus Bilamarchaeum dharawalense TaxID=2885759 RepID=A0A5E4LMZ2_9ARCH|nr:Acetyltransferase (GNAT) family protein [Candidatus Bilamarchaeum dharawalense]